MYFTFHTLLQCKNTIRIEFVSTKGWKRHDTAWLLLLPYQKGGKSPPMGKIATSTENEKFLSLTQRKLWVMTLCKEVDLWIFLRGKKTTPGKKGDSHKIVQQFKKRQCGYISSTFFFICRNLCGWTFSIKYAPKVSTLNFLLRSFQCNNRESWFNDAML